MSYVLQRTATHPQPRREGSTKRSGGIPVEPGSGLPSIGARARRHSLPRLRVPWSGRRRTDDRPGPRGGTSGSGVSPIAGGASRGVAFFVSR